MNFKTIYKKYISYIGFHQILMVVAAISIIVLSILLAGCTSSNGLSNVYLLSLQYKDTNTTPSYPAQVNPSIAETFHNISSERSIAKTLQVRAGYMGLCVTQGDTARFCSSNAVALANLIKEQRESTISVNSTSEEDTTADPLNLIWIAQNFRETIVFDGLLFIAVILSFIFILLLYTFPGWYEDVDENGSERDIRPFPSRPVSLVALAAISLGFAFALVAILWQHLNSSAAASMAESLTYGAVEGHVGTTAMVLGWAGVVLIAIISTNFIFMVESISILNHIME